MKPAKSQSMKPAKKPQKHTVRARSLQDLESQMFLGCLNVTYFCLGNIANLIGGFWKIQARNRVFVCFCCDICPPFWQEHIHLCMQTDKNLFGMLAPFRLAILGSIRGDGALLDHGRVLQKNPSFAKVHFWLHFCAVFVLPSFLLMVGAVDSSRTGNYRKYTKVMIYTYPVCIV